MLATVKFPHYTRIQTTGVIGPGQDLDRGRLRSPLTLFRFLRRLRDFRASNHTEPLQFALPESSVPMSPRARRRVVRGRSRSRPKGRPPTRPRPLVLEGLEQRLLLAGDLPAWQNPVLAEDVNADSVVAIDDALLVANELYKTGPRALLAEPQAEATGFAALSATASMAEGEHVPPLYLDVNGDNYLTPADALLVVTRLIAEGQIDLVELQFDIRDTAGTPIDSVNVGDSFELKVFVEDIRHYSVPNQGVASAYLDVLYDSPLISIAGPISFGPEYRGMQDQSDKSTPGEIRSLGNALTDWGVNGPLEDRTEEQFLEKDRDPLAPFRFTFFTIPFTVDAAPIDATDDDQNTDAVLNVGEDAPGVLVDVLANDTLGGPTELGGGRPADESPTTYVLLSSDLGLPPDVSENPVPPEAIIYGSDTLEINSAGSLTITNVEAPSNGGTAVSAAGGTRIQYSPPAASNALGAGETASDSFDYTISDGLAQATATVTVTIVGQNDAPTAQDVSFATDEEVLINDSLASLASDPDTNDSLTFSAGSTSRLGATVLVNPDGTFLYVPSASATLNALPVGESLDDTFTYSVEDGHGGSADATVTITVSGQNDAPRVNDDLGPGFTTDEDHEFVTADVLANDSDVDGDLLSISGFNTAGTVGDVTYNGDGTFSYDPRGHFDWLDAGQNEDETFTYTVSDGNGSSRSGAVTITVNGVNDSPVAGDDSGLGFTTDQDTAFVTGSVFDNDSDAENDTLSIVEINTTGTLGEVTDNGDGEFNYDPNGQFDWLAAGETASDEFGYVVSDGNGGTDDAIVTITVTGLNDGPIAQDASFDTHEDAPLNDTLENLASDPDLGDTLVFSGGSLSTLGASVSIDPDGTFAYDPAGSATLQGMLPGDTPLLDTFSYTVSDGDATGSAEVTITVSGRNDAPIARDDDLFVDEQSGDNVLDVLINDSDADAGDALTVISVGPTDQGGSANKALDGLSIIYTPDAGFIGTETFVYTIEDGAGATSTATVVIDVEALRLPRARNDSFTVAEDSKNNALDVFGNDRINDEGTPIISLTGLPNQGGEVTITGPTTLEYMPAENFFGTETFLYKLSDGVGIPEEAVVTVTVTPQNDAPASEDDGGAGYGTDEDTPFTTGNVLDNDDDVDGDTLSVTVLDTSGTSGDVTYNGDGTFDYDPNGQFDSMTAGQSVPDTFSYTVSDGNGGTDVATVTITIDGVNDPPVANDDSGPGFTTDQDTAFDTGNVLDNDSDAEDDTLTITGIDTTGTVGDVTANGDGTYHYDPNGRLDFLGPGESTTDSFVYTVSDGNGGTSDAKVTITVIGFNNPPVAGDDSGVGFTTDEDTDFLTADVLANDSDIDGGTLSVIRIDTAGIVGEITYNGDGTFSYSPNGQFEDLGAGESRTESFEYELGDGQGDSAVGTVTLTINGINDAPIALNDEGPAFTTDQDSAFVTGNVLDNDHDDENDTLSVLSIDTTGTLGQVTDKGDGTFDYDPGGSFDFLGAGESQTDTFDYTVGDGNGGTSIATVTVKVTGLNDAPRAENASFDATEDAPVSRSLASAASDPDSNDTLVFSADGTSALGAAVNLSADGTFSYDPGDLNVFQALLPGESLPDTFTYTVTDGSGAAAVATATINVAGVNDDPTAVNDTFPGILEDSSDNLLDVLTGDFSAPEPGEKLTVISVGATSAGGTVVNDGSQLRYTPAPNFFGTESFSYTIGDGNGGSDTALVSVEVTPTNDAPTARNDSFRFVGPGSRTLKVLANDTFAPDVGESLTIIDATTPDRGGTVINQGDELLYTPPPDVQGEITETFTYTIDDGTGETATATVTIDVVGFTPSTLSGTVFIDSNGNGRYNSAEKGIGGFEVTLRGVDMFGESVSLATNTSGDGSYSFTNLVPGDYTIRSKQPVFLLDGAERIGTQGGSANVNDQLSVSIGNTGGVSGRNNNFGELGLQPRYLGIWDFLNTNSGEGILFATDSRSGQEWFSFLDGWDNFTSATAEISANGSKLNLTFVDQSSRKWTTNVAFSESSKLHIRGSSGTRHLVQLLGRPSDFRLRSAGMAAEGERVANLPDGKRLESPASPLDQGSPASTASFDGHAPEGVAVTATGTTSAGAAEGEFPAMTNSLAEVYSGLWYGLHAYQYPGPAPASTPQPSPSAWDVDFKDETNPTAGPTVSNDNAPEDRLLAVDAVFSSADDGDPWEPLSDEVFDQQQKDDLGAITQRPFGLWDKLPT